MCFSPDSKSVGPHVDMCAANQAISDAIAPWHKSKLGSESGNTSGECFHSAPSARHTSPLQKNVQKQMLVFTFRAMTKPEGLWRTLLTTPPFPAPNSQMGSKSSSFSSPTWAFWVRKASSRFLCCSSRSSSPSFFCKASRFALRMRQGTHTHTDRGWWCRDLYHLHTSDDAQGYRLTANKQWYLLPQLSSTHPLSNSPTSFPHTGVLLTQMQHRWCWRWPVPPQWALCSGARVFF